MMSKVAELRLSAGEIEELVELLEVVAANLCLDCERGDEGAQDCALARWVRRLGEEERFRREYEVPCL
ncbi:MAG: hypothetical protein ACPLRW_05580 [Moorellales bacterium]